MIVNLFFGFLLASIIALAARRVKALSRSGAIAALVLGTVIFGLGGFGWALLLLTFFISSSALSRLFGRRKRSLDEKYAKGSVRDAWQVLANGGVAGGFTLLHAFFPAESWPWVGCAAALAAANADTWATELGIFSPTAPRLITTGRPVEPGTSGGISWTGTLAALGGAVLVAVFAGIFWRGHTGLALIGVPFNIADLLGVTPVEFTFTQRLVWIGILTLCGLAGSLVDSFFGATLQVIYHCPACQKETERHPLHSCGTRTVQVRGLSWLDNDWVNTVCTLSAALLAVGLWFIL
jgi:uncharacterized protein (TIGR00297 family)